MSGGLDFPPESARRWEWPPEELERVGRRVAGIVARYLTELPETPAFPLFPADAAAELLAAPLPETGATADEVLDEFERSVAPYHSGQGHPRYWGWVNPPPTPIGIFADALAAAMNPSVAGGNHAAHWLERQVVGWFRELVGLPPDAMGLLVSGGSAATLTALGVARHVATNGAVRRDGLQGGGRALAVYASAEGHSAIRKAAELLGIGERWTRAIGVDERYRMRVDELEAAIERDLAEGVRPMAVAVSAGTVNTGAIDPLAAIADVCERHEIWLHVDGAYGAPAILTDRHRAELAPLERADSLALDPHKWLYVPIDAGLVLVRDGAAMRAAFSLVPDYIPRGDESPLAGPPWLSEYGLEQTRRFRALKVWAALRHHGIAGYRESIERDLRLADHLATLIGEASALELVARGLSIVCFRHAGSDELNRRLHEELALSGRAFVSSTVLGGRFVLRACILNPRTRRADLEELVGAVLEIGSSL
jgi:aromatic-L-amino-acid/L-tryptophan decarboxylase